jgi:hypothetical protein
VSGWLLSTAITYALFASGNLGETWLHEYVDALCLALSVAAVGALGIASLALRRNQSPLGAWIHSGGVLGRVRHIAVVTTLPVGVFLVAEVIERLALGLSDSPPIALLLVGVMLQAAFGLLAFVVSRGVLRAVERFALAYRCARTGHADLTLRPVALVAPRLSSLLGSSLAGRAPPTAAVA